MKNVIALLLLLCILFLPLRPAAAEEVQGIVREVKERYLVVEVRGGSRRFEISRGTRAFGAAGPMAPRRIMLNSRVLVVLRHGMVDAIFVREVPK